MCRLIGILLSAACLLPLFAGAQVRDSLGREYLVPLSEEGRFARHIDLHTSTRAYRMTYVAVPLIVGGVIM